MSTSLDDVLTGEATETGETEEVVESTGETETEATDTTETVENDKTEETKAAPPADKTVEVQQQIDDLKGQVKAFQRKAEDEVRKRQTIEQKVESPDAYVEPDKAILHAVDEVRGEMVGAFRMMQENNARANHDDYDEKFEVFEKMAADNPALLNQLANEFDPAEFVYKTVIQHEKLETVGDLDAYAEKIRAEERTKVLAEIESKTKNATEKAINDAIPTTLSDVTAAGGSGGQKYTGRTPLSTIIGKK